MCDMGLPRVCVGSLSVVACLTCRVHATSSGEHLRVDTTRGGLRGLESAVTERRWQRFVWQRPRKWPGDEFFLLEKAPPEPAGVCIKNSGKDCYHFSANEQCNKGNETCSATRESPYGFCQCLPGYCAGTDRKCHRWGYRVIAERFQITVSGSDDGAEHVVFMGGDGVLRAGTPLYPSSAQWQVAVLDDGSKLLWTEAYSTKILQEYETCKMIADHITLQPLAHCSVGVGGVEAPSIVESGWRIEFDAENQKKNVRLKVGNTVTWTGNPVVRLRAKRSGRLLVFSSDDSRGTTCTEGSETCNKRTGLKFYPPLIGRIDVKLDRAPSSWSAMMTTAAVVFAVLLLVTTTFLCVLHPRKRR
eukprot:TRINITY_DN55975_c0_g1_i1.p1 TRINITY_DN55975_c0_g1~~TRINITY_DN55975_c0_g1_i1.p1  ORF type:complete len:359 (-),score=38.88 TRINITY_DN55975_c0_g1_i1:338-1414(-)